MKLIIDERIKHRLTGLIVLLAIVTIFVPALMKRSNQRFEGNINFSVKLPPKPQIPNVVAKDNKTLFKTVNIAKIDNLPRVTQPKARQIVKAIPIKNKTEFSRSIVSKVPPLIKPNPTIAKTETIKPIIAARLEKFSVQIASFSQQSNAEILVSRLRSKGYKAYYAKFNGRQGEFYKVMVGQLSEKNDAILLQKKLAAQMQLNGFVVRVG